MCTIKLLVPVTHWQCVTTQKIAGGQLCIPTSLNNLIWILLSRGIPPLSDSCNCTCVQMQHALLDAVTKECREKPPCGETTQHSPTQTPCNQPSIARCWFPPYHARRGTQAVFRCSRGPFSAMSFKDVHLCTWPCRTNGCFYREATQGTHVHVNGDVEYASFHMHHFTCILAMCAEYRLSGRTS